eukprot:CAMPEP_0170461102 /NCGR_PEP_ID=MMETSP0123-20130129/7153_1 /TAXON_ID=182087 /ORGANISM="Favella ehrenbergii, Strain Fehren 1" /LENGTH=465 /DNA_ID=CAMNT_0010726077 /DNA_START=291 /DNA_END=1688 /DNA_ORIENTATION=+
MLSKFYDGVKEMQDELCEAMRKDLGRDMFINYIMEIMLIEASLKHEFNHLSEWMKEHPEEVELLHTPGQCFSHYEPLGVVAVFGSWNAPLVTTLKPLMQAISAGNCVIVKPSEISSHSSTAIKKLTDKYLDKTTVVTIEGGVDVASAVNELPLDMICFTGSTQVGRIIAEKAAKNLTPCILELGGKCPLIIDHSAVDRFQQHEGGLRKDYKLRADLHRSRLRIRAREQAEGLREAVRAQIQKFYGEKPEGSDLQGKMINEFHTKRVKGLIDSAGGTIICGGKVVEEARYVEPTIILKPDLESKLMKEEIFGPVMPVFPYKDINEVIRFINARDKPLAVYYFGNANSPSAKQVCMMTSSGAFVCNEVLTQINNHSMGFGGVGKSGYGRHGGYEGFKNFSNRKAIMIKSPLPSAVTNMMVPPYGSKFEAGIRKWGVFLLTHNKSSMMFYIRIGLLILFLMLVKVLFF